jgi:hypothetical protein
LIVRFWFKIFSLGTESATRALLTAFLAALLRLISFGGFWLPVMIAYSILNELDDGV